MQAPVLSMLIHYQVSLSSQKARLTFPMLSMLWRHQESMLSANTITW